MLVIFLLIYRVIQGKLLGSHLENFGCNILDNIKYSIILVTGDSDKTVPYSLRDTTFKKIINSNKIIRWYSQNCALVHPKLSQIPIGLDYHTMIDKNTDWDFQQFSEKYDKS